MKSKLNLIIILIINVLGVVHGQDVAKVTNKKLIDSLDNRFNISGYIEGMEEGLITIRYRREGFDGRNTLEKDTVQIENGNFNFSGSVDKPVYCTIWQADYLIQIHLWLENGNITINGSVYSDDIKISGSKTQDEDVIFHQTYDKYSNELMAIAYKLNSARKRKESQFVIDRLLRERDSLEARRNDFGENFIREHPNSMVSLTYLYNCETDEAERMVNILSKELRNSGGGKRLLKRIKAIKASSVGKPIPDCTQIDGEGNEFKFSDYEKKYLMICISSSVNGSLIEWMRNIYSKYNNEGLEIIDVFINAKNQEELNYLIGEHKISWKIVSDYKGNYNEVVEKLNVNRYPSFILVDNAGVIIARDLSIKEVESRLSEIFN